MEMMTQHDCQIASCLKDHPISEAASHLIATSRNLGDSRAATAVRTWSVAKLFDESEKTFNSSEEPISGINRILEETADFMEATIHNGFHKLGNSKVSDANVKTDRANSQIESITGEHYGKLFSGFSMESYFEEPTKLLKIRLTRNNVEVSEIIDKSVLDAGCGGGRYTVAWRKLGAYPVMGVDISGIGISDAQKRVSEAQIDGVEFKIGNNLELPFLDNAFDVVFSNGVLHHTSNWKQGVAELVRVLKPNGLGWLYLIENPGGLFWDIIEILRVVLGTDDKNTARKALQLIGVPDNRIFYMLDHVLVPINLRLTPGEIEDCLHESGSTRFRRLKRGADFDRIERIYQQTPYADIKYGIGENRYVFSK